MGQRETMRQALRSIGFTVLDDSGQRMTLQHTDGEQYEGVSREAAEKMIDHARGELWSRDDAPCQGLTVESDDESDDDEPAYVVTPGAERLAVVHSGEIDGGAGCPWMRKPAAD